MKIKDICNSITDGSHNPPQGIENSEYMMLSSKNVFDNEITFDEPRYLSKDDFEKENKRTKVTDGDVLLTIVGTVGRTAVVSENMPKFTLQRSVAVLHPNKDICSGRFLMYALRGKRSYIEQRAKGVAQKGIYLGEVSEIDIDIPRVEEQQAIIEKLDKICEVIHLRQQELTSLDELIKARFVELMQSNEIVSVKLKDVVEEERIITYGMVKPGNDVPGGVIIIKVKDFPNGTINTDDFLHSDPKLESKYARSRVKEGDLLFSIRGTVGRTAFVTKELEGSNITQDTARLSIESAKYDSNYIRYALGFDEVKKTIESHIKGVAMKGISLAELREIEIPCVDFKTQKEFGKFVKQVDKSKVAVQKALDETQTLFDSLMQQYFG